MRTWDRVGRLVGGVLLLAFSLAASMATAQTYSVPVPPTRSPTDSNSVNLASGQIAMSETDLSIGPPNEGGLAYTRFWSADTSGGGWRHNYLLAVSSKTNGNIINLGDQSVSFTKSGANFSSDQADGSTLSVAGNIYTYTERDGTVIAFDRTIVAENASYYGTVIAVATSIRKPSGEVISLTYYRDFYNYPIAGEDVAIYVARLKTVASTTGYQLRYAYASDNPSDTDNWYRITSVSTVNGAIDYCDPIPNTCSTTGATVSYSRSFSGSNTVENVTDPQGRVKRYTTNASRRMIAFKRPSSTADTLTFTYGPDGRVSSVSNGVASWSYAWSLSGTTLTGTVTQPLSRGRTVTANTGTGNILTDKDGLDRITQFGYDSYGRRTSIIASEGNSVTFAYDARGNLIVQTAIAKSGSGLDNIVSSAVYPTTCANQKICNQPISIADARHNVTNYSYDSTHGGVLTVTAPAAALGGTRPETRFGYSALYAYYKNSSGVIVAAPTPIYKLTSTSTCQTSASCVGTADEIKSVIAYGVTGAANTLLPTSLSKGSGDGALTATTTMTYDYAGNMVSADGPLAGTADTTSYAFNADRQVTQVTSPDPDGGGTLKRRAVQYGYSLDGQVTNVAFGTTAENGSGFSALQQKVTAYDTLGRKVNESMAASGTIYAVTQYSYDVGNRLDCVAVRMNPAAFGSLPAACVASTAGIYGPDRIAKYGYDAADQQTKVTTGFGVPSLVRDELTMTYTINGKLLTVADAKKNLTTYAYDGFDRLSKTRYPSPTTVGTSTTTDYEQLTYDAASNPTVRRLRDATTLSFAYDDLNRLTTRTPSTNDVAATFGYDLLGRLVSSTDANGAYENFAYDAFGRKVSETAAYGGTTTMRYDVAGRRTRLTWSDGFFVTYDYDVLGEMTAIRESGAGSGIGVLATFAYDDLGRRRLRTLGNGTATGYGYDAVSRLASLTTSGSGGNTVTLSDYNPAGQIGSRAATNDSYAWTGSVNLSRSYTVNGLNQYTASGSIAPTYDARGNLTNAGAAYTYNARNLLTGFAGGSINYNALGQWLDVTTEQVRMVHDDDKAIAEFSYGGTFVRRYVFGPDDDEPIVWYEGAGTGDRRWLDQDERGSVTRVANDAGTALAINTYDEFGIPATTNLGRFQYTGQAVIPALGIYYYKARMYSATLGRFMQTDPIGYADGPNWYNYVGSDPVNRTDPSGLQVGDIGDVPITVSARPYRPVSFGLGSSLPLAHPGIGPSVFRVPARKPIPAPQKSPCNQTLVNAGNALNWAADEIGTASTAVGVVGLVGAGAGLFFPPAEAAGLAAIATAGVGGTVAAGTQFVGGILQGLGGAGYSNAFNAGAVYVSGRVFGAAFGYRQPSGYRTVSQRIADYAAKRGSTVAGGVYDAATATIPNLGPTQATCPR